MKLAAERAARSFVTTKQLLLVLRRAEKGSVQKSTSLPANHPNVPILLVDTGTYPPQIPHALPSFARHGLPRFVFLNHLQVELCLALDLVFSQYLPEPSCGALCAVRLALCAARQSQGAIGFGSLNIRCQSPCDLLDCETSRLRMTKSFNAHICAGFSI